MHTKLAALCDRLIEAGWLAAIVTIPLYLNALSSRVFEPDKIQIVRVLALFILVVWAIRAFETVQRDAATQRQSARTTPPEPSPSSLLAKGAGGAGASRHWLLWPTLAVVASFLLASVLSVAPGNSFLGSYQRLQGTISFLACCVIGLAVAYNLKTRAQLDRLITTAILTSVPVSVYGILQHLQRDPMPWTSDVTFRVSSTMGNSIFVAAYYIMVIPLTLVRWFQAAARVRSGEGTRRDETVPILLAVGAALLQNILFFQLVMRFGSSQGIWWAALPMLAGLLVLCLPFFVPFSSRLADRCRLAGYGLLLGVQLLATVFSQSRGPWLGLIAGLAVLGLAFAVRFLGRRGVGALAAAGLAFGLFVGLMNVPGGPLEPLRSVPYLGRLGSLLESDVGTGRVRVLIWRGTVDLFLKHPAPGIEPDRINALRPLVGFGPETMFYTFNKVYPPELANIESRTASPDRAHNETLQNLVELGLIGTIAFWVLMNYVMFRLLDAAGLVEPAHRRLAAWLITIIGLPALIGYLLNLGLAGRRPTDVPSWIALPAIGLLAALVAHFVEIQFGIAIAVTRTYFFIYAGAAVALSVFRAEAALAAEATAAPAAEPLPEGTRSEPAPAAEPEPVPVRALTPALATASVRRGGQPLVTPARSRGGKRRPEPAAGPGGAGGAGGGGGSSRGGSGSYGGRVEARAGDLRLDRIWLPAGFVVLTVVLALLGGQFDPLMDPRPGSALGFAWLLLGMICFAYPLMGPSINRLWQPSNLVFHLPLAGLLVVGAMFAAAPTEADVLFKRGQAIANAGAWGQGLPDLLTATSLQPAEDHYYLHLGRVFLEIAKNAGNKPDSNVNPTMAGIVSLRPDQINRLSANDALRCAETVLLQAQRIAPLNTDHYANLGRLNRFWFETGNLERGAHMINWYERAVQMSPDSALLRDELAQAYLSARLLDQALATALKAREIDPRYDQPLRTLADVYAETGNIDALLDVFRQGLRTRPDLLSDNRLQRWLTAVQNAGRSDELIEIYREVIAATPRERSHALWQPLGVVLARSGRPEEAIAAFEQAVQVNPGDWNTYRNVATLYHDAGRYDDALTAVRRAIQVAPADRRGDLQQLQQTIENRRAGR